MSGPGIYLDQLRALIVRPALELLEMHTPAAEDLVMGTAMQESLCFYLKQHPAGPALGLWQMEPATHNDIWDRWLRFRPEIQDRIPVAGVPDPDLLVSDLQYGAIMCRLHYYRVSDPLPAAGDIDGYAAYWKRHYNTPAGAGTADEFAKKFREYLTPKGD